MRVSAINLTRSPTLRALPTMETSYRFTLSPSSTRRRMASERPGQLQIAVLITSLSETYCGRWIVACYRAHPVAGRCCNLCPKSKGRTELLARPQRIACHFPFAFSPATRLSRTAFRERTADTVRFIFCATAGAVMPASSIARSCSSSTRVHGRPAGRGPVISWP